ncbi:gluconokinase [Sphingomonas psychrotolerans]|uniref:Gluconokinase n=1 Tax=Sphingomonas psychrotolerans TaxID=1327635 RepID=A0ABU3MXZ9_9SPHN|nr:gluconokinase [Sphingomonas psychrotolerans]MDT8757183.1 gluconokinase [Sphingomonas psychrotolerans]
MAPTPHSRPFAVLVMGVTGCGKSTLGALLARALDCPFLEGDDFHSAEAIEKMRNGRPLTDEDRAPWLERVGAATARSVAEHGAAVTACSALRKRYRDRLRAMIACPVQLVHLDVGRERLLQRLAARAGHFMPPSLLDSQLATLEYPLAEERALTVESNVLPGPLRDSILAQLKSRMLEA